MTVYIEYAFLENFLLDGALIWLASKGARTPITKGRWLLAALIGGIFAILYPLLSLTPFLGILLKISVGMLLCLLAVGGVYSKKGWAKYALFTSFFFILSFFFGGAIGGIVQEGKGKYIKALVTPLVFLLLSVFFVYLFHKLYKRSAILRKVYPCIVINGEKSVKAQGFYDSGNIATKNGRPVCFLSPEIAYALWGEEILFSQKVKGYVCDEMKIVTMSGEKKVSLYKGGMQVEINGRVQEIKEVFFALSVNIVSREYTLILHSRIFDIGEGI